ncbi:GNAT family N-acetyltransferase [Muricauda sp. CAU 1633]|uniref:GNAT family N-acetyltransferase n=1 Tax=Allomuricauda sp. CAU 1633 TaxID=2816036 RepID=UPI001A9072F3|nr:GNAT family N-acetyltransferase [Muricauda sp. CAU 1633]MBO0322397.1 GNAT family N-acetyltransferase [Muricauda sp. CAU 1633]
MQVFQDRNAWGQVVDQCEQADFYHTYDYHQISKKTGERPILVKYERGDSLIAIPLLIRDIEGTELKDATSVYGYVGPIGKNIGPEFNNEDFKKQLCAFLRDNQIVSVFSRLHPYITKQDAVLKGVGKIVPHGNVVNIDLTQSLEQQKQQYGRRLRTYINKEAKEYEIIDGTHEDFLDEFIGTYCDNMKRLHAKPSYFFGKKYFYKLLASGQIHAELLVARHKKSGDFAGGAIFTKNNGTVQYHLSGVKNEYFHLNPIKLLIDHVRKTAAQQGFVNFNLGGGLSGHDNDSLFYFKSGFSKDFKTFCSWQYVVDDVKYEKLLKQREALNKHEIDKNSCFFPLYRQDAACNETEISKINCLSDD